jgi:hypothetical protein
MFQPRGIRRGQFIEHLSAMLARQANGIPEQLKMAFGTVPYGQ